MSTFEIRIDGKEDDCWPVVVERTRPGEVGRVRSEGTLRLNAAALPIADPTAYGTVLGQALFQGTIRTAFTEARAQVTGDDRLRVLLTVEADDLRNLRWERLAAPFEDRWDLLALKQEVPFSLYLPTTRDRRFGTIGRPRSAGLDRGRKPERPEPLPVDSVRRCRGRRRRASGAWRNSQRRAGLG
jgi:hypothetical protein